MRFRKLLLGHIDPETASLTPALPLPQIELSMTKRVLAAELGTVSETLSRTLAKFREQKVITVSGRVAVVNSPARLLELLRRNLGVQSPRQGAAAARQNPCHPRRISDPLKRISMRKTFLMRLVILPVWRLKWSGISIRWMSTAA